MNNWTSFNNNEDKCHKENIVSNYEVDGGNIIWQMTDEQKCYYMQQFKKIIPANCYKLPGFVAKEFFELSKLSIEDLRNIWELADQDKDGFLKLGEFCVAMHLVVLKKNGLMIPRVLPPELLPYMDMVPFNEESLNKSQSEEKPSVAVKKSMHSNLLKRLPSDSSLKSDAISLTEDMTAFDSKPPEGDKITYPVPFKPTVINSDNILSTIAKPEGPKKLIIEGESYNLDKMDTVDGVTESKNESDILMKTPPVPPRYRLSHKSVDNSNSYPICDEDAPPNKPLLDKNYLVSKSAFGIDFSQVSEWSCGKMTDQYTGGAWVRILNIHSIGRINGDGVIKVLSGTDEWKGPRNACISESPVVAR